MSLPVIPPSQLPSFTGTISSASGAALGAAGGALVADAASVLGPQLAPGFFRPKFRSIGGIHAHVTIEESERDEVTITEHPVEQGAPIADHAFKRQEEVMIKVGWNMWDGDLSAEGGIYGILLQWQASFIIFDLVTGKRVHKDMLITSMSVTTNQETEFALMADITCRQVILTKTEAGAPSSGDRSDTEGNGTSETKSSGERSATAASDSVTVQVLNQQIANGTGTVGTPDNVDEGFSVYSPGTLPPSTNPAPGVPL